MDSEWLCCLPPALQRKNMLKRKTGSVSLNNRMQTVQQRQQVLIQTSLPFSKQTAIFSIGMIVPSILILHNKQDGATIPVFTTNNRHLQSKCIKHFINN